MQGLQLVHIETGRWSVSYPIIAVYFLIPIILYHIMIPNLPFQERGDREGDAVVTISAKNDFHRQVCELSAFVESRRT